MLDLDNPAWSTLEHAYGSAADIPALLRRLAEKPDIDEGGDPWYTLWSALAHQGDVYPASFAALPHIVHILSQHPEKAGSAYFLFPAWVEICRQKNAVPVPEVLREGYFSALKALPGLVLAQPDDEWDENTLRSALSAVAAAKGYGSIAEAILELDQETAENFLAWFHGQ
jgi:hypothetical protein